MKRMIALGGAVAGMLAYAAFAAPAATAKSVPAPKTLAQTNFAAKQVAAFWFAKRAANLQKATPYAVETTVSTKVKHKSTVPTGAATTKPGLVGSSGDQKQSSATAKNVNLPRTVGKVFFIGADGKPHWCTGTALQGRYKNIVATAGHCVFDVKRNRATLDRWVFVPGYYKGKTPWGIYVGKTAYTHYDFSVYEDGDRNYAFVTVYNGVQAEWEKQGRSWKLTLKDAGRLGDNVGGQGLAYNQKLGAQPVFVFGYPSGSHPDGNFAFTGQTLKWSYGKPFAAQAPAQKAENLQGIKSAFTGEGALGSAWLLKYSNATRLGYLNGVTIGVADTDGNGRYDTSVSPYFDGETLQVYQAAEKNWSGKIV